MELMELMTYGVMAIIDIVLIGILIGFSRAETKRKEVLYQALGKRFRARMERMDKALAAGNEEEFKYQQQSAQQAVEFCKGIL